MSHPRIVEHPHGDLLGADGNGSETWRLVGDDDSDSRRTRQHLHDVTIFRRVVDWRRGLRPLATSST